MLSTIIIFFKTSEYTVRGMAGYAGKFNSMVSIFLHDCKEPDMVGLFDGNSHKVPGTCTNFVCAAFLLPYLDVV